MGIKPIIKWMVFCFVIMCATTPLYNVSLAQLEIDNRTDVTITEYLILDFESDTEYKFIQGEVKIRAERIQDGDRHLIYHYTVDSVVKIRAERIQDGDTITQGLRIFVPEEFGTVSSVKVNGIQVSSSELNCYPSCRVTTAQYGVVEVENKWGGIGRTIAEIEAPTPVEPKEPEKVIQNSQEYLVYVGVIAFVAFLVYKAIKRLHDNMTEPLRQGGAEE